MSKRKKKEYDDDDGRVISSMNVDGMPWYNEKKSLFGGTKKQKERPEDELHLTKQETRAMMGGVFAAALLVAISMILTLFSGIIPSRSAAKKDPVVALRTE